MQRPLVDLLSKEVRAELDARIVKSGFANYRALSDWLATQGYQIRKSAVHSHGQKLQKALAAIKLATQEAQAVVAAAPDDDNTANDALLRLVQQRMFTFLVDMEIEDIDSVKLSKISRGVADIARASISQKKYMQEARERVKQGVAKTSEQIELAQRSGGLSPDTAKKIRNALGGIKI